MARKKKTFLKFARLLSEYGEYIVMLTVLIMVSGILSGFIYAVMNRVPPAIFLREGMVIVVSTRNPLYGYFRQTGIETVGIAFLILLCGIGGLLMIEAPRRIKSHRLANLVFILGSLLFIASMIIILGLYVYGKGWSIPF